MKTIVRTAALAVGIFMAGQASAVLPFGRLTYKEPVATVGATEAIDVWMTLTLDPASPALDFSSYPLTGFDPADLPLQGRYFDQAQNDYVTSDFVSMDRVYLNTFFECSDTFTNGCNGADPKSYTYTFFTASEPGKPSINFLESFSLAPGQTHDYVFATFTPTNGSALPGVYKFYGTGVTLNFAGYDASGNYIVSDYTLANSCQGPNSEACAFTREVAAIPEPASAWLALAGLSVAGVLARRARRTAAR